MSRELPPDYRCLPELNDEDVAKVREWAREQQIKRGRRGPDEGSAQRMGVYEWPD